MLCVQLENRRTISFDPSCIEIKWPPLPVQHRKGADEEVCITEQKEEVSTTDKQNDGENEDEERTTKQKLKANKKKEPLSAEKAE